MRRTTNPRLRLRDKHVVAGLYVAPLLLITVSSGLLFSKLSGTVVRGGTALTGALPRALVKPPKSTPIDGAPDIDLDTVFAAAAQYGGAAPCTGNGLHRIALWEQRCEDLPLAVNHLQRCHSPDPVLAVAHQQMPVVEKAVGCLVTYPVWWSEVSGH